MEPVIETAADLYREIKRRGLHLRTDYGRDNALLAELCKRLGCPDDRLAAFLEDSPLSAGDFLRPFLAAAAPFARMFQEIWSYLSNSLAKGAREEIRVRFGHDEESPREFDLDAFRELVETSRTVRGLAPVNYWSYDALQAVFGFYEVLGVPYRQEVQPPSRYKPGQPYQMMEVREPADEFETIVRRVRDAFQAVADHYLKLATQAERLPELTNSGDDDETQRSRKCACLLTDLLPIGNTLFYDPRAFDSRSKRKAVDYFKEHVEPQLRQGKEWMDLPLLASLDVLNLPFWRDRWQTYEIWASIKVLEILGDYRPRLEHTEGRIHLDGFSSGIAASLNCSNHAAACAVVQMQTPFVHGQRKAIKPDLSICFDRELVAESRAIVVEYKQRASLDRSHVEEVGRAYKGGSPRAARVLLLNYDSTGVSADLPKGVFLLENVRPDNTAQLSELRERLEEGMRAADMRPELPAIVLLDVSGSMGSDYSVATVQKHLRDLCRLPSVRILRFNAGLVSGGDISERELDRLGTGGGTDLRRALVQIEETSGLPHVLLVVTDGGYRKPVPQSERIASWHECTPQELSSGLNWLRSHL